MTKSTSVEPAGAYADDLYDAWIASRGDHRYNVSLEDGQESSLALDTAVRPNPHFTLPSELASNLQGPQVAGAIQEAQWFLAYTDLSLCMAFRLREHLDSATVVVAADREVRRLTDLVHERALTAVVQFSLLAKVLHGDASTAPESIDSRHQWLGVLRKWADIATPQTMESMGREHALAVRLLTDVTDRKLDILQRDPAAQRSFGTYDDSTGTRIVGARADALNLLYGSDIGSQQGRPGKLVTVDMSKPEVQTLLGLARAADALNIDIQNDSVSLALNAEELYSEVEEHERRAWCATLADPPPLCTSSPADTSEYLLSREYGISLLDARVVVQALVEAMFGQPRGTQRERDVWNYSRVTAQDPSLLGSRTTGTRAANGAVHVLGKHSYSGPITEGSSGRLHLDPDFVIVPLRAVDLQRGAGARGMPPLKIDLAAHPHRVGMDFQKAWHSPWSATQGVPPHREFGTVPALALAREAIVQSGPGSYYDGASSTLGFIETSVGPRTAIFRPRLKRIPGTNRTDCADFGDPEPPASCQRVVRDGYTTTFLYGVDITSRADDPAQSTFWAVENFWQSDLAGMDPDFHSLFGTNADSFGEAIGSPQQLVEVKRNALRTISSADRLLNNMPSSPGAAVFLESTSDGTTYRTPLYVGGGWGLSGVQLRGYVTAFGGSLNERAERLFEFAANDWSRPRYDGFDLPTDWVPLSDASLRGGSEAQEDYQYLLGLAAQAAEEAGDAIGTAFDSLVEEASDRAALNEAEMRAERLTDLEAEALCGSTSCTLSWAQAELGIAECVAVEGLEDNCNRITEILEATIPEGGVALPEVVANQLWAPAPDFGAYGGSELEGLLTLQWNSWREAQNAVAKAIESVGAASNERAVAREDLRLAEEALRQAEADVEVALQRLEVAEVAEVGGLRTEINTATTEAISQLNAVRRQRDEACSDDTFEDAAHAAYTRGCSGGPRGGQVSATYDPESRSATWEVRRIRGESCSRSFNPGPIIAAEDRCIAAEHAVDDFRTLWPSKVASIGNAVRKLEALEELYAEDGVLVKSYSAQLEVAHQGVDVARARTDAADRNAWMRVRDEAALVQSALATLYSTNASVRAAFTNSAVAVAQVDLNKAMSSYEVESRMGLRRKYRSYDLWRAEALADNARRLAVAARRSIEARFVVDLSKLRSSEPFVDSPSLWADEIYSPSLQPTTIGRRPAPEQEGGRYAHRLADYVHNLELFVAGFTVQRPSTQARADSEVLQLPAPAETQVGMDGRVHLTRGATQWVFRCAEGGGWRSHPAQPEDDAWDSVLDALCAGDPPIQARLTFTLDPWGRSAETRATDYGNRYNMRWDAFAVNLVGTGLRDCQQALDPATCYAEPFVRYDLVHVGPALVVDHSLQASALHLPALGAEGGKALAIEEWLDPIEHGWNLQSVQAVSRAEFAGRPLGGTYELTLHLDPSTRLDKLERIQLLTRMDYWVRQD